MISSNTQCTSVGYHLTRCFCRASHEEKRGNWLFLVSAAGVLLVMLVQWGIQVFRLIVHRKRNKWRMKKDYASPAVVQTGCPRCPRVCGTYRCGISLYPVRQLRLIISMFCFCFAVYWNFYCLIISASVLLFFRKSWHHDLLFRWAVLSTEVFAEGAASVRLLVSLYRSALYNQMGDNTGTDD